MVNGRKGSQKNMLKQVEEESMDVDLGQEDVLCGSKWIVDGNLIVDMLR